MAKKTSAFRVGRVRADQRSGTWYLTYHDNGKRYRPRVGKDRDSARKAAAKINAELEMGIQVSLSFESLPIDELRRRYLDHHEHVARSSVATIRRYRAATAHLIDFAESTGSIIRTASFRSEHAEQFVRYLRSIRVSPNGHPATAKRPLRDKGMQFILQTCRAMFHYAGRQRCLPPDADNPFTGLRVDRLSIQNARPIELFSREQERLFLECCSDWQLPLFLTLILTGMRPGELSHLIWPDDVDLEQRDLHVRSRPELGWQVKTRRDRSLPIHPVLCEVLKKHLGGAGNRLLFQRRTYCENSPAAITNVTPKAMLVEAERRAQAAEADNDQLVSRELRLSICRSVWRDVGIVKTDRIRTELTNIASAAGIGRFTSPKMLRHLFATTLQDANVDPLIRMELMGHSTTGNLAASVLGTTAVYTHTRSQTKRSELERALNQREAVRVAEEWLEQTS